MRKLALAAALVVVGALTLSATIAFGDEGRGGGFRAKLDGYQEVPSKSTIARGTFRARIVGGNTIHYTLEYANAETPAAQAHIHFAQRHTNGGISAFLCGGGDKPPCPPTSGTVTGIIDPSDVIGPGDQGIEPGSMPELIRAMKAGATYVNVHTARFGGGEFRGQIRSGDDD
jgi:CHRD domain-containing protein